jgi:RNA polymerase sigma-70 factor, ECF subfamily
VGAAVRLEAARGRAEALYREHFAFVWRNARRLGCSDEWVDDATHEVFLVATRRLDEFQGRSSERTWLFAITFRIVGRLRRDRARRRTQLESYVQEQPEATADAERETEAAQYLRLLLQQLSESQRVVLILAELEGFTSAEIAETLGIPVGTVDSRLRAARTQLARIHERERAKGERWRR